MAAAWPSSAQGMTADGHANGGAVSTIKPPEIRSADGPAGKVALPRIRLAALLGMLATAALLGVVSVTAGLGAVGWITGLVIGSAAAALLVTARIRSTGPAILPADWVTLTRMMLIAGVTGLVADSFTRSVSITALVTLSAVALALDAVDGQVARRTGTATPGAAGPPVLAQGRGRGPGHRADRRRLRSDQPPGRDDRGRRRAAVAGRVVRPRCHLALPRRGPAPGPPGRPYFRGRTGGPGPVVRPGGPGPQLAVLRWLLCPRPR